MDRSCIEVNVFQLEFFEKAIIIARRGNSHIEAIKRKILGSSRRDYIYDRKVEEEGKT